MSTTFGVRVFNADSEEHEFVEVAFRSNGIRWTNPIAHLLDDAVEVTAMDNSPQGIYTICDIKKAIENPKLKIIYKRNLY